MIQTCDESARIIKDSTSLLVTIASAATHCCDSIKLETGTTQADAINNPPPKKAPEKRSAKICPLIVGFLKTKPRKIR